MFRKTGAMGTPPTLLNAGIWYRKYGKINHGLAVKRLQQYFPTVSIQQVEINPVYRFRDNYMEKYHYLTFALCWCTVEILIYLEGSNIEVSISLGEHCTIYKQQFMFTPAAKQLYRSFREPSVTLFGYSFTRERGNLKADARTRQGAVRHFLGPEQSLRYEQTLLNIGIYTGNTVGKVFLKNQTKPL